jgi:hypothetical protein
MIDATAVVGILSAATALVASVTGPVVSLHVARTQIRATVLSANRQRWIDAFRETVAEFCSEVAVAVQMREKLVQDGRFRLATEPEVMRQFERLIFTTTRIRLMVNPAEKDHQDLLAVIDGLLTTLRNAPTADDVQPRAEATGRQITAMSHAILRHEWLRVQRGH